MDSSLISLQEGIFDNDFDDEEEENNDNIVEDKFLIMIKNDLNQMKLKENKVNNSLI